MMRKLCIILSFGLLALLFTACGKPDGSPKQVLSAYYDSVKDGNFTKAYSLFSEETKAKISEDDFIVFQKTNRELNTLKETKIDEGIEKKDVEIDGKKYKYSYEYNIVESITDLGDKKETTNNYKRTVVSDGKEWRIYREGDLKKDIAFNLIRVGAMYLDGKGKDKNAVEAISLYKKSLEYDKDSSVAYYELARALVTSQRYDEAEENLKILVDREKNPVILADVYNMKGAISQGKNKIDEAIQMYKKALEYNKDQEYAKTNLAKLESLKELFK